jgi:hypothetical protein
MLTSLTYAVALSNTALPAAAWYFPFHLSSLFVFSLSERKNEQQKEDKVPPYREIDGRGTHSVHNKALDRNDRGLAVFGWGTGIRTPTT